MYSLNNLNKNNIKLAKSLVIKLTDVALQINKGVLKATGKSPGSDPRQWKYYLNISGQKHFSNQEVMVNVIEVESERPLTKELLDQFSYTKQELLKQDITYNNLLNRYPNDILYIHGCMYPVDIEEAIQAEEGTILGYNKKFVNDNEFDLITDLERYIKSFISRYHILEYTLVDELYLPAMLGVLYSNIPNKIFNIRLNNVYTNMVHEFHLEHFFRSKLHLWGNLDILDKDTIFWLYKNLNRLKNNIGIEQTLEEIDKNILLKNMIGLGEYVVRYPNPVLLEDQSDYEKSSYKYNKPSLLSKKINSLYVKGHNKEHTLDSIIEKELTESPVPLNNYSSLIKSSYDKIATTRIDNQKSKILELSTYEVFNRSSIDLFKLLVDYWTYGLATNKLNYMVEYIEPNTSKSYVVDCESLFYMFLKLILTLTNTRDTKLSEIKFDYVFTNDPLVLDAIYAKMLKDDYVREVIDIMQQNFPYMIAKFNTKQEFTKYIWDLQRFYDYVWAMDSNSENCNISAGIKQLMQYSTQVGSYTISTENETIDDILVKNSILFESDETWDIVKSIEAMIQAFSGIELDQLAYVKSINVKIKEFVEKITSYTVQVFTSDSGENSSYVYYNNIALFMMSNPIVEVEKAEFFPLEEFPARLNTKANNLNDNVSGGYLSNGYVQTAYMPDWPFHIRLYNYTNNILGGMLIPTNILEIHDKYLYPFTEGQWEDKFLEDVTASFTPYEDNRNIRLKAKGEITPNTIKDVNLVMNPVVDTDVIDLTPTINTKLDD